MTSIANTITITETEATLLDVLLPKGTLILLVSKDCAAAEECLVKGKSGNVIFHSFAEAENTWRDQAILPHDVHGITVAFDGQQTSRYLYFIKPSGRVL